VSEVTIYFSNQKHSFCLYEQNLTPIEQALYLIKTKKLQHTPKKNRVKNIF
jgi:hypothetical protein